MIGEAIEKSVKATRYEIDDAVLDRLSKTADLSAIKKEVKAILKTNLSKAGREVASSIEGPLKIYAESKILKFLVKVEKKIKGKFARLLWRFVKDPIFKLVDKIDGEDNL